MRATSGHVLLASALATFAAAQDCSTTCESSGTDFMDGGSYFQNINSNDPFTAFETFDGCQNDTAYNMLVAPNGDQYECNTTPMQPDDTQQLVTCPLEKNQLYSGNWSIIIISNNGQCAPIDYIRQFSISAGAQVTSTIIGTTTVLSTSTPVSSTILTSTSTITSQTQVTTTVQTGAQSTYTTTPAPVILFTTKGVITLTQTRTTRPTVATTTVETPACTAVEQVKVADRKNTQFAINVGPNWLQDLSQSLLDEAKDLLNLRARSGGAVIERHIIEKSIPAPSPKIVMKRHPDAPTTTVTNLSTTSTITSTVTAPIISATGTTTILTTVTSTTTLTQVEGSGVTTVTASGKTNTIYFFVPVETTVTTITRPVTSTVTTTATAC